MYLERPGAIRCIVPSTQTPVSFLIDGEDTHRLFVELREAVFGACEGTCFGRAALEERYAPESNAGFTAQELAHLVSCRTCLDQVNVILDLPLLEERTPESGLDRDNKSGPNDTDGQGGATPITRKRPSGDGGSRREVPTRSGFQRSMQQLFEHRPDSLQIAVDGETRTSQKVTAETNELHLKLARKEEPSFIEVFSEQGFCLAYLHVDDPGLSDQLEQVETITLSDNRSLVLTLSFAAEVPIVHVVYRDPVIVEMDPMEAAVETEASAPAASPGRLRTSRSR
jgi:hypothetical protein